MSAISIAPAHSPLLHITKGNPSDEQLAALSAIVSSLAARPARSRNPAATTLPLGSRLPTIHRFDPAHTAHDAIRSALSLRHAHR